MKILAIDTSCDDTSIAVLSIKRKKFEILSNVISSQIKVHQKYGGVYPTLAKREHQKNLVPVLKQALKKAELLDLRIIPSKNFGKKTKGLKEILKRDLSFFEKTRSFLSQYQKPKIDMVAITIGPGLEPCLWTGVNFAKALAHWWNTPIIPVNHIEGHIVANFLPKVSSNFQSSISNLPRISRFAPCNSFGIKQEILPAVCLVVSGGHTQLVLMTPVRKTSFSNGASKNWNYKIIGETRDDAAGECFDKTARTLGLSYPGGPSIAAEAKKLSITNNQLSINLPRPMINSKNYDFSFSGLKTAVLYDFKKRSKKIRTSKKYIRAMAKEIQQTIIDILIKKTIDAVKEYKVKTIMLGGGVIANKELRKQFQFKIQNSKFKINFLVPQKILCTDNAAMIGIAGYFNQKKATKDLKKIKVESNLRLTKTLPK